MSDIFVLQLLISRNITGSAPWALWSIHDSWWYDPLVQWAWVWFRSPIKLFQVILKMRKVPILVSAFLQALILMCTLVATHESSQPFAQQSNQQPSLPKFSPRIPSPSLKPTVHYHPKHHQVGAITVLMYAILLGIWVSKLLFFSFVARNHFFLVVNLIPPPKYWLNGYIVQVLSTMAYFSTYFEEVKEYISGRKSSNYLKRMTDLEYAQHLLILTRKPYSGIDDDDISASATYNTIFRDFLILLTNEEDLLGMFLAHKLNPYSAWDRACNYFVTHSVGFLLYAFISWRHNIAVRFFLNVFILCPSVLLIGQFLYWTLTMPCCLKHKLEGNIVGWCSFVTSYIIGGAFFFAGLTVICKFLVSFFVLMFCYPGTCCG